MTIGGEGYDSPVPGPVDPGRGAEVVAPSRRDGTAPRTPYPDRHTDRNRVERFSAKTKQYRRVAAR
ncbi:hypothetical protein J0H58_36885 [bacterium]|nr:hypothetical protein [bacterium]